jgi:hypothetical protein
MDVMTERILDRLGLPSLITIALDDLERHDPELAAARQTRSRVEYCWTAAAPLCLYCLEQDPTLKLITYLDADVMFYANSAPVAAELGSGSILLTPHRYAPRWQWLERDSGKYNVQLVTFRRDPEALEVLRWWRARCIEWCYARVEDGKFGDQRYLDDWPERFPGTRVLEHPSSGFGPWSSGRYTLQRQADSVLVEGKPLIFHHFHGLHIYRPGGFGSALDLAAGAREIRIGEFDARWSTDFPLTQFELNAIWQPYVVQLARQKERVLSLEPGLLPALAPYRSSGLVRRLALRMPRPLPALASHTLHAIASRSRSGPKAATPDPHRSLGWQKSRRSKR